MGETELMGVGEGTGVGVGVKGETCLGLEPLAELETGGWRQGVGLWDLLKEATPEMGEVEGVWVRL